MFRLFYCDTYYGPNRNISRSLWYQDFGQIAFLQTLKANCCFVCLHLCDEIPFADLVTLLFLPARDGAHLHRRGQRRQCHLLVCRQAAAAARHEPRPAGRRQQLAGPSCRTAARSHGAPRRCPTDPGGAERSAAPRQPRGPRGYAPREHPPHAGAGAAAAAPTPLGDLLRPGAAPHGSHDAAALP